jgi:2,4-dienoyl-CoA reductase-like NADH-dependent reductase (Old Yellow Enzyme family)
MMLSYSGDIKRATDIMTTTSWFLTDPNQAESALCEKQVDFVMLGREMLRDPHWPYHAAKTLGDASAASILPDQYARAVL